jgi:hypothetical protein
MCEMLHANPAHQNYQQMGEWWEENNTCKLPAVRYVKENMHAFIEDNPRIRALKIGACQS